MEAILIRHAESAANIGLAAPRHDEIPLSPRGREQAAVLAGSWTEAPNLIITSSFLRARCTSHPTCLRFPDVPVHEWPIHEFTYLEPSCWNGTTPAERRAALAAYWRRADPAFRDGPSAESFVDLCERAKDVRRRLSLLDQNALVLLFTHQQFITAFRLLVEGKLECSAAGMSSVLQRCTQSPVANAAPSRITLD